jgi:excisionase family DNA binding protein
MLARKRRKIVLSPLLLSVTQAAEALAIGRTKIHELLATGALESVKLGRSRKIPVAALEEYVARLREESLGRSA